MPKARLGDLRELIDERLEDDAWWAPGMIKDWVRQLSSGLEAAHQKRIIHRDLKPQNVLVSSRGGSRKGIATDGMEL